MTVRVIILLCLTAAFSSGRILNRVKRQGILQGRNLSPKLVENLQGLPEADLIRIVAKETEGKVQLTPSQVATFRKLDPQEFTARINRGELTLSDINSDSPVDDNLLKPEFRTKTKSKESSESKSAEERLRAKSKEKKPKSSKKSKKKSAQKKSSEEKLKEKKTKSRKSKKSKKKKVSSKNKKRKKNNKRRKKKKTKKSKAKKSKKTQKKKSKSKKSKKKSNNKAKTKKENTKKSEISTTASFEMTTTEKATHKSQEKSSENEEKDSRHQPSDTQPGRQNHNFGTQQQLFPGNGGSVNPNFPFSQRPGFHQRPYPQQPFYNPGFFYPQQPFPGYPRYGQIQPGGFAQSSQFRNQPLQTTPAEIKVLQGLSDQEAQKIIKNKTGRELTSDELKRLRSASPEQVSQFINRQNGGRSRTIPGSSLANARPFAPPPEEPETFGAPLIIEPEPEHETPKHPIGFTPILTAGQLDQVRGGYAILLNDDQKKQIAQSLGFG